MARLTVRVTPRAGRNAVGGLDPEGHLRVRVTAAPAEGAANKAVVRLIARALAVPPSRVTIVSGASARIKTIEIAGLDHATVEARLPSQHP